MCNGVQEARGVPNGFEASTSVQIGVRRSQWYLHKRNQRNIYGGDAKGSVKLLNGGGCKSRSQGRRLEDIKGSMVRGCDSCCDGGSNVENELTPIKTRLLRKCQSSGYDTMLEILKSMVLYFTLKECT